MLTALAFLTALTIQADQPGKDIDLTVRVEGAKAGVGKIVASLFDSEEAYMEDPHTETSVDVAADGSVAIIFQGLAAGTYAVSVYYDENSDGEMNTNWLGIPKEAFGFSNDAPARFGPPKFEKAQFDVSPETNEIVITLDDAG